MNGFLYACLCVSVVVTLVSGRKTALYAAVLLMPTLQVMPAPLGLVSSPSTLIIIALARLAFSRPSGHRDHRIKPLVIPLIFLFLALMVGLGLSANASPFGVPFLDSLRNTWYWTVPFVVYLFMLRIGTDDAEANRLIALCQLSMGLECVLTVMEAASGVGRATAHLGDPNTAGGYFAATSALFLVWLVHSSGWKMKLAFLGGCLAATVALFNTVSRGGLLACAVTMLLVGSIYLFTPGRAVLTKVAAVVVAVLLVVSLPFVVPEKVKERVLGTVGDEESLDDEGEAGLEDNAQERLDYWLFAWDLFRARPTGYGAFEFPSLLAMHFKRGKQTHNVYLQLLVEQGIQGCLALLFLLGATFRFLAARYRSHDRRDWKSVLALSLIAWLSAHAVAHFFVNSFFNLNTTGQFWILVALLASKTGGPVGRQALSIAAKVGRAGPLPPRRSLGPRGRTRENATALGGRPEGGFGSRLPESAGPAATRVVCVRLCSARI